MADIIINGPEGQSTINNIPAWATEATQENIASILTGIGNSTKKSEAILNLMLRGYEKLSKATKDGDKEVQDLLKILEKSDKEYKKSTDNANKTIDGGIKELEKLQRRGIQELDKLNRTTTTSANDLDKILSDLNNSSDGLMSFAGGGGKLLGGFGLALDVATKVTGAFGIAVLGAAKFITSQFIDTFKFLNAGLKQGTGGIIGLTQSVDNVAMSANLAGMSLDEFGEFAAQNSKILRTLGAEGFAKLYTQSLMASGGLMDIGMTADDAVESVMTELEYRRRFGLVLTTETTNLRGSLMQSARELRVFANAVGMSEQDLRGQSEVAENHIDMLQANAMMLGANSDEIINSTQTISRQLGAAGLGDLINPLFEAISKGSTGLSEEFIEIGKVAPELIQMVEKEAASFNMTGQLNANLSSDIVNFVRDLSDEQMRTMFQLQAAGDGGATALNNLRKNVQRLSDEQIQQLLKGELDMQRLSVLDTFNSLGFIVNQATASIGDMGKTAVLSALGFDQAADGTINFNDGVTSLSDSMLDLVENVFGKNTRIYGVMEEFDKYITTMFSGTATDEEIEDALDAFTSTINKFGQEMGLALNRMIKEGTLFDNIKKFFSTFFDELRLYINDATGGMFFDDSSHAIMTRRFLNREVSNTEFTDYVGKLSGEERVEMSNQLFRNQITDEADRRGISRQATIDANFLTGSAEEFEKDGRRTRRILNYLRSEIDGFDQLSEQDRKTLYEERVLEIQAFNEEVEQYVMKMDKLLKDKGINTVSVIGEQSGNFGDNFDYMYKLAGLEILTDINEDNIHLFSGLRNSTGEFGFDSGLGTTTARKVNAQKIYDQGVANFAKMSLGFNEAGVNPSVMRGKDNEVFMATDYNKMISDLLADMQDDGMLTVKDGEVARFNENLANLMQHKAHMSESDLDLINQIKELVDTQKRLTSELMSENSSG